jgi:small subunit ribosomal protein S8
MVEQLAFNRKVLGSSPNILKDSFKFKHNKNFFMCPTLIKTLVKLKNASIKGKEVVFLKFDLKYFKILKILYREGFIQGFKIDKKNFQTIVYLRFFQFKNVIDRLKFLSIPSHHHFISFLDLNLITNKKTFILLSTNKGLKTLLECKKQKLGGKLLFLM